MELQPDRRSALNSRHGARRGVSAAIVALLIGALGFAVRAHLHRHISASAPRISQRQSSVGTSTIERDPQALVRTWISAVASGDYRTACRLMDDQAQADLHQGSVETCEQAVVAEYQAMDAYVARRLGGARVLAITTVGARSLVRVKDIAAPGDVGLGFLTQFSELRLTRGAAGWLVTALVAAPTEVGEVSA
jgi:hypothetical protein